MDVPSSDNKRFPDASMLSAYITPKRDHLWKICFGVKYWITCECSASKQANASGPKVLSAAVQARAWWCINSGTHEFFSPWNAYVGTGPNKLSGPLAASCGYMNAKILFARSSLNIFLSLKKNLTRPFYWFTTKITIFQSWSNLTISGYKNTFSSQIQYNITVT